MKKNVLGPTLKALSKMKGLTQAQLAEKVGLSRTSIVMIERQDQALTDTMANKIAQELRYKIVIKFEKF